MIEARTMSKYPALSATSAMISSGALPKVALSKPPMASPVRVASCSVERTISRAMGTIASAAEKNSIGAGTCACSSTTEMGMKTNNQLIDGLSDNFIMSAMQRHAWCEGLLQEGSAFRSRPLARLPDPLFSLVWRNHGNRSGNYYPILPHLEE